MFLGRNPPLLKESRRTQCAAAFFVSSFYFFSIFIFSHRTFHLCHPELISTFTPSTKTKRHQAKTRSARHTLPTSGRVRVGVNHFGNRHKAHAVLPYAPSTSGEPIAQAAPVKLPQLPRGGSPPLTASACESAFRLAAPPPTTAPLPTKPFLYNFLCQILLNAPQDNPPRFSSPALNTSPACPNPSHFRLKKQYSPLTLNKKYLNDSLTFTFFVASPLIL